MLANNIFEAKTIISARWLKADARQPTVFTVRWNNTNLKIAIMQEFTDPTLNRLFQGIKGFQQRFYEMEPDRMRDLVAKGQSPEVLLIACSDSRADPALLTGAAPGDLFVVRNVANLVPPYCLDGKYHGVRSAIEFAVRDLEVRHIIVLGHAHCGGIETLLSAVAGQKLHRDFIGDWVSIAMDACCRYVLDQLPASDDGTGEVLREMDMDKLREHQHLVERAAIQGSIDNLATYPWLKERLDAGLLHIHGWWFDLETGDLWTTGADNPHLLPILE
jgi:carbonic anhydrase